jgi:ABC-type sugar transport system ATPase subunit
VVLKDGVVALDSPSTAVNRETLLALLIRDAAPPLWAHERTSRSLGEPVMQLVCSVDSAPFFISRGEIVGIALGARRSSRDILRFAAGLSRKKQVPRIEAVSPEMNIKYLSRERNQEWDFPRQTLQFCLAASSWSHIGKLGWIATGTERALATDLQKRFAIVADSVEVPIETLSGGNRQKALLARLCARTPDGLLLDEPFSGVDAPTRQQIQAELSRMSSETGIVLVSQEWEDMVTISDRVLVLQDNGLLVELREDELTPEAIERSLLEGYQSAMEVSE